MATLRIGGMISRYRITSSAGSRDGRRFAVLDSHAASGGSMRRISWHRTEAEARAAAKRLNESDRRE